MGTASNGASTNGHAAPPAETASYSSTVERLNRALHTPMAEHPLLDEKSGSIEEGPPQPEPDEPGSNGRANGAAHGVSQIEEPASQTDAPQKGPSNGVLVIEGDTAETTGLGPLGESIGRTTEPSHAVAENGSVGSSLGGVSADIREEDRSRKQEGQARKGPSVAVLARPVESKGPKQKTREEFLIAYRKCLAKQR